MAGMFSNKILAFILRVFAGTGAAGTAGENGLAINAQMDRPRGLGFDKTKENLYISVVPPVEGGRILRVNLDTGIITRVAGDPTKGLALTGTGIITSVTASTSQVTYTLFPDTPSRNRIPPEISPPTPSKHSFGVNQVVRIVGIADASLNITGPIKTITDTTITLDRTGTAISPTAVNASVGTLAVNAGIGSPYNVVFDSNGNMYFSNQDYWSSCILRVDTDGYISRYAGNGLPWATGSDNLHRLNTSVRIGGARGVAIDSSNNIYIAETDSGIIVRRIDAVTNLIKVIVGSPGNRATIAANNYPNNGLIGTNVRLRGPTALVLDSTGSNLYILDVDGGGVEYNGVYRYNINDQKIYVILQSKSANGIENIPAINAQIFQPRGIDIDNSNNLYISDNTQAIRIIDSNGNMKAYRQGITTDIIWHLALRTPTELYAINSNQVLAYKLNVIPNY
jgi:hypothetical protein